MNTFRLIITAITAYTLSNDQKDIARGSTCSVLIFSTTIPVLSAISGHARGIGDGEQNGELPTDAR